MDLRRAFPALCLAALAAGCGGGEDGAFEIAYIASPDSLFSSGTRLSEGAQHVRAATGTGLVARDAQGEIIPGLADRWIVTDEGRSYIFRLRDGTWPDGTPLTAESARAALRRAMRDLRGTSMGLDLAPVEEVRAMAGRVVELRLSAPFPALLQLLAQPELALSRGEGEGLGPMTMERVEDSPRAALIFRPPEARGLPSDEDWQEGVRPVVLAAASAREAIAMFDAGQVDAVLGGQLGGLPLVDTGPLSRGTVRIDPANGLFGLAVMRETGPLADEAMREAIGMAIDRPDLIAPFNIGGWTPTTRVVNPGLPGDPGYILERWAGEPGEQLRAEAARRVIAWRAGQEDVATGEPIRLTLDIGEEPGLDLLLRQLAGQLAGIGIELVRAEDGERADLALVDRLARYAGPRWFLDQFNCALKRGLCSEDVDYLVSQALMEQDSAERASLLAEAEAELTLANIYIPFGTPLRWSLVRSDVTGFSPNRWAFHPLPSMAEIPR